MEHEKQSACITSYSPGSTPAIFAMNVSPTTQNQTDVSMPADLTPKSGAAVLHGVGRENVTRGRTRPGSSGPIFANSPASLGKLAAGGLRSAVLNHQGAGRGPISSPSAYPRIQPFDRAPVKKPGRTPCPNPAR